MNDKINREVRFLKVYSGFLTVALIGIIICGGLVYDGNDTEAGLVLSIDKYRDDQVMQLQYIENTENNARTYGMQFWDYPKEDGYEERNEAFEAFQKLKDGKEKSAAYQKNERRWFAA